MKNHAAYGSVPVGSLALARADGASATVIRVLMKRWSARAGRARLRADHRRRRQHVVQRQRLEPHVGVPLEPAASPRPRSSPNTRRPYSGAPGSDGRGAPGGTCFCAAQLLSRPGCQTHLGWTRTPRCR